MFRVVGLARPSLRRMARAGRAPNVLESREEGVDAASIVDVAHSRAMHQRAKRLRVHGNRALGEHARRERRVDRSDGHALHLNPEVLTGEPRDVAARERAERGGRRPRRKAPLAGRV